MEHSAVNQIHFREANMLQMSKRRDRGAGGPGTEGTLALLDLQQAITLSPIVCPSTNALPQTPDHRTLPLAKTLSRQLPVEWKVFQSTMPML